MSDAPLKEAYALMRKAMTLLESQMVQGVEPLRSCAELPLEVSDDPTSDDWVHTKQAAYLLQRDERTIRRYAVKFPDASKRMASGRWLVSLRRLRHHLRGYSPP